MSMRPIIITRHFTAASRAAGGALLREDPQVTAMADTAIARGWIAPGDRATVVDEITAVLVRRLFACGDDTGGAVTLETALKNPAAGARHVLATCPREGVAQPPLSTQLDALTALSALHSYAPPLVQIPIEHAESGDVLARPVLREGMTVSARFGWPHLRAALERVTDACARDRVFGFDPARHAPLAHAVAEARAIGCSDGAIATAIALAQEGEEDIRVLDRMLEAALRDDDAPAQIALVIDAPDSFIEAALTGHGITQITPAGDAVAQAAAPLLQKMVDSAWLGVSARLHFRDRSDSDNALIAAARAHGSSDAVVAGACALPTGTPVQTGAINVLPFMQAGGLDVAGLVAATRTATLALAARHDQSSTAINAIALSIANIGALVMAAGLAYDSLAGRTYAAAVVALVTATMAETAAQMAAAANVTGVAGGRDGFARQLSAMRQRLAGAAFGGGEVGQKAAAVSAAALHDAALKVAVLAALDSAADAVRRHGVAVLPVSMVSGDAHDKIDARAADIAPLPAIIAFAEESGADSDAHGYRRTLSPCVLTALQRLGYTTAQIDDIYFYVIGHASLLDAPHINHASLRAAGCDDAAILRIERALALADDVTHAINVHVLGRAWCSDVLGIDDATLDAPEFDLLGVLGFDETEIRAASFYACGTQTLAGAPHLQDAHLAVFDTEGGLRAVDANARLMMQAALEPFLTGAVAQTITAAPACSRDDLAALILAGWEAGVKNLTIYRAGSGLSAPAILGGYAQDIDFEENLSIQSRAGVLTGS